MRPARRRDKQWAVPGRGLVDLNRTNLIVTLRDLASPRFSGTSNDPCSAAIVDPSRNLNAIGSSMSFGALYGWCVIAASPLTAVSAPGGAYRGPQGYRYRPVSVGYRFAPSYYARSYWVNDYSTYQLARPRYGYQRWVRYGGDVVLVDIRSGRVVQVRNRYFR